MSDDRRPKARWLAAGAALLVVAVVGGTADGPEPCCFENERYAGVCKVVPEPGTTCADILDYLNNPASSGKTYCGTTEIRGGWSYVRCSDGTKSGSQASQGRTVDLPASQEPRSARPAR